MGGAREQSPGEGRPQQVSSRTASGPPWGCVCREKESEVGAEAWAG